MCMDVEEAIFICSSISIRDNNVGGWGGGGVSLIVSASRANI